MRTTTTRVVAGIVICLVVLALIVFQATRVKQPYKVGAVCSVQLKRDLLGLSCERLVLPTTGSFNENKTALSGRFVRLTRKHLVVNPSNGRGDWHFDKELWIPLENVLMFTGEVAPKQ